MIKKIILVSCVANLAMSAVPARAAEVLTNGNFQSGLTGWTSFTTSVNGTISEIPNQPLQPPQPQVASVVSFDVTGSGATNALFLNAGKGNGGFGQQPGEGGGVFQTFTTTGGLATFSADIAAFTRANSIGVGVLSVLVDGVVLDTHDFGNLSGPATLRSTLGFTKFLDAGQHTVSLRATRLFGPGRGVTSQYFDNVALDVSAIPEPATWGMMIAGFGMIGGMTRRKRNAALRTA